ncbi:pheromone-regulated protein prm10 [Basidiobolus ranarum]|uniref:Pheromone-regulated protein prm10 n=1 Tax=Basidiobolus ranarum TaxID=34480 RepID=A0ABR2VYQ6_9FUNG
MITFGSPAHRLEQNLYETSKALNLNSSVAYMPGVTFISFWDPNTHTSDTHILRSVVGYHMDKLEKTYFLSREVIHEKVKLKDAYTALEDLLTAPPTWPWWVQILNYPLCSFCMTPSLFHGSWLDAVTGAGLSLGVGTLALLSEKIYSYNNVFELSAAILCAFVATALHKHICYMNVIVSSVALLLPGLPLTSSVLELASKNSISGVIRLVYALVLAFMLGFGLNIGSQAWRAIDSSTLKSEVCYTVNPYWQFLLIPILAVGYCISLNASFRQWPPMLTLSFIGYTVSYFTSQAMDVTISAAISSFAIAFIGNVYARISHRFGFGAVLAAVMMLVPGSLGVKGFLQAFGNSSDGLQLAFQMVVVGLSIAMGLFMASLMIYPQGKRHTALIMF